MTNKQQREYKFGNQMRKLAILKAGVQYYLGGVVQDGAHSQTARKLFKKADKKA